MVDDTCKRCNLYPTTNMDKNVEAIATKFLTRPEDFELIKEENYKNYVVYFAAYKEFEVKMKVWKKSYK